VKLKDQMAQCYSKCFRANYDLPDPASFDPKIWILLAIKLCPLGIDGKDYLQFHIARGTQLSKYNSVSTLKAYRLGRKIREKGRRTYAVALGSAAKKKGFRSSCCSYVTANNKVDALNQAMEQFRASWREESNAAFRPQVVSLTDITGMDESERSELGEKISRKMEAWLLRKFPQ
jgi:hypothetical protein